jgi:arginine-tRNA-protein transferase
LNGGIVHVVRGVPTVTRQKLDLYDRYHTHQSATKNWPAHAPKNAGDYEDGFVNNPFPVEEWRYYLDKNLVGVGYVDLVPDGLSAVYFYYDPSERQRGLGTWNVLCIIQRAAALGLPYVYLGYHVADSKSLAYKASFVPYQVRRPDGLWGSPTDSPELP